MTNAGPEIGALIAEEVFGMPPEGANLPRDAGLTRWASAPIQPLDIAHSFDSV
jgi:hypothetical protein